MSTLYLIEQNTVLRKTGDRLLLCKKRPPGRTWGGVRQDDILLELPCADVDHVMAFGNVQITTQALQQLLRHGIETALFSFHGQLLGQLTPPGGKNILLRQKQYQKKDDMAFVLAYAKAIVQAKISMALELVRHYAYNHPKALNPRKVARLEADAKAIDGAATIQALLGHEGAVSALYFRLLGKMLTGPYVMKGRTRRPPRDEPNAVLSFGYTIVGSELHSLLDGLGFDPYLGYYHQVKYGRPALALDMLELFRHSLVDRLMLRLFNKNILNDDDFMKVSNSGVYLSSSGKKKFFIHYERLVGTYRGEVPARPPQGGLFRRAFQEQAANLVRTVVHDEPLKIYSKGPITM